MSENYFEKLAAIDCSEYVEKKGKFSYLSWTWAVKQLRKVDPTATWEVIRHNGLPYLKTECGFFVEVAVTCQGITLSQIHPVLNGANKPIPQPNSFDINTSIQRCLVKAIALHGLGLYIYAGEDLPEGSETPTEETVQDIPPRSLKEKFQVGKGSLDGFEDWVQHMQEKGHNFKSMEQMLADALNKKVKESKEAKQNA